MRKIMTQVGNMFEKYFGMPHGYVIYQHKMLMNLSHISYMRNDRNVIFACQQTHRKKLTDSAKTRAVGLEKAYASSFKIVLEYYAIRDMLAQSECKRSDLHSQLAMRSYIVRMGWLFDPQRAQSSEFFAGDDGLRERPLLIGIKHESGLGANELSQIGGPLQVAIERSADL